MKNQMICTNCGWAGKPVTQIKGSFFVELFLWLCFLLPGIIYSVWRLCSVSKVCVKCRMPTMIPLSSPMGQRLAKEFYPKECLKIRTEVGNG